MCVCFNWIKGNQQLQCNCVYFLKIYLFIYLFIAPTSFDYSLAIIRVLVIWYSGRKMCIFSIYSYLHQCFSVSVYQMLKL
jgi:hypothetical protein